MERKLNNDTTIATIKVYRVEQVHEGSDGIREFCSESTTLNKEIARKQFLDSISENDDFKTKGIFHVSKNSIESNFEDGFSSVSLIEEEIPFTKDKLQSFLETIDSNLLKEVLPKELLASEDPLMSFIADEIPFRMKYIHGLDLEPEMEKEMIQTVQNQSDILFDYEQLDFQLYEIYHQLLLERKQSLNNKIEHMKIKEYANSTDTVIDESQSKLENDYQIK